MPAGEPSTDMSVLVEAFQTDGWVLTEPFDPTTVAALSDWVDEVAGMENGVLHHRERTADGVQLCRTEDFVPHHSALGRLLTEGTLVQTASALLGEEALLYKEKINYKYPGGAGFSAHQDAPAYRFVDVHVSCLVAVDDTDLDNGCLEVVSGAHDRIHPMDERGCIDATTVASFDWRPVPVRAGQVLWFHSRTPHRSAANRSPRARRAVYPTYNAASAGDLRAAYYERKRTEFAAVSGARISLIGDFEGEVV